MSRKLHVTLSFLFCLLIFAVPSQVFAAWGRGHFYIIGTGPAGPQTATLQALETIRKMDVLLTPPREAKFFSEYIGETPILCDPWAGRWDYKGKSIQSLSAEEKEKFKTERYRIRDERIAKIKALLEEGKNVGLLDSGNPCIFGPSHWYLEYFEKTDVIIIPGMGCDAAAMAALGKSVIPAHDTRFVIQSAPMFLMGRDMEDRQIVRDLAKYPATWIQYMALGEKRREKTFAALNDAYPPDTPCAVVFWAGYPELERVIRGTIADMEEKLAGEKETFMGLLFVGKFLEGKPYEAAVRGKR